MDSADPVNHDSIKLGLVEDDSELAIELRWKLSYLEMVEEDRVMRTP